MRETLKNSESATVHAAAPKRRSGHFLPQSPKKAENCQKFPQQRSLVFFGVVKIGFCHPVNIFSQEHYR
ncbi:MAG: hypothetical protein IIT59_01695 [Rhodocyclaceae bacterium]|nr:hypothetical protein [Rhodocyclaceae bacterium]